MTAVERSDWKSYCDRVSKELEGRLIEIEVASLRLGDQVQAQWVPLIGLVYDPKNDLFEIAVEGLDHLIHKPCELYVDETADGLKSLEIVDIHGTRHLVYLREPLMLPAPHS